DVVARFRHARRLGQRPFRAAAKAEEADAQRLGDLPKLGKVGIALTAGLVDRFKRRAGQLELTARLERDRALPGRLHQSDDVTGIDDRLPSEHALHAFQQRLDPAVAAIGYGSIAIDIERKLLVLGADSPLIARLVAGDEV